MNEECIYHAIMVMYSYVIYDDPLKLFQMLLFLSFWFPCFVLRSSNAVGHEPMTHKDCRPVFFWCWSWPMCCRNVFLCCKNWGKLLCKSVALSCCCFQWDTIISFYDLPLCGLVIISKFKLFASAKFLVL